MTKEFHAGNRRRLYAALQPGSILVMFAGREIRKTNDEMYPFYTDRNFLYLTGIDSKESILMALCDGDGAVSERVYVLPPDPMKERWTGRRLKPAEVSAISGIDDVRYIADFPAQFHQAAVSGNYGAVYLDLFKIAPGEPGGEAFRFKKTLADEYPYLRLQNANPLVRELRTIKQPCEIEAMRRAEEITRAGITAIMRTVRPGMYEYQMKAEFDRALGQYGPQGPAFPSIISAGQNNFCIHYYSYTGQAQDGDMILNDVGAWYDNVMTDVSRGYPCNGRFTERQRIMYEIALATSNHMFSIIKPGMPMADVDPTAHAYCAQLLKDAGIIPDVSRVGDVMWHNGAHHVGYDVHDVVRQNVGLTAPGMVFCVDIGLYYEEWGIGFRVEDNCLVTEDGCENLSAGIPRTIAEIEDEMGHRS